MRINFAKINIKLKVFFISIGTFAYAMVNLHKCFINFEKKLEVF
jgi:hypothetical protein